MGTKTNLAVSAVGAILGLPLAYITHRVLTKWGALDEFSDDLGDYLKVHVEPSDAGWVLAWILAIIVYGLLLWFVWHTKKPRPEPDALPITPVLPPPPTPAPSNNTFVNAGHGIMPTGHGNTIVGATDANGNVKYSQGGVAIGAGAQADSTSIAIGAGAGAGLRPPVDTHRKFGDPPKRDVGLGAALAYAITKSWDEDVATVAFVECKEHELEGRMEQIDEAVRDGDISIWGKETVLGMSFGHYSKIPKSFWEKNRIEWGRVIDGGDGATEKLMHDGLAVEAYEGLMVSKEEFERVWPK
jgi:hypothetical protein